LKFEFDYRPSDAPWVDLVWRTQSDGGSFMSAAASNLEMVITKQKDAITLTLHGPFTKAFPAPVPEKAEIFGIVFKLGTFVPHLPANQLLDGGIHLPAALSQSFWLYGSAWQIPNFENADTFICRLIRQGILAHEPLVPAALQGQMQNLSERSVQRRFRRVTGLTPGAIYQIERARHAMTLLQQGVSILDTVEQAGYYDQSHMTRALKQFIGQTPAQIIDISKNE
jgi:AraC-like DNA-binding protein